MVKPSMKLSLVQEPSPEDKLVRIAFATSDNEVVDQHFGSACQFAIFTISDKSWQLIELIEFNQTPAGHNEDKLKLRVNALIQCSAIYCNAIGMSAIKQLLALKIKPVNVEAGTDIKGLMSQLVSEWQKNPNFWLAKEATSAMAGDESDESELSSAKSERLTNLLNEEWEP